MDKTKQPLTFDWDEFVQSSGKKPCFICGLVAGKPENAHDVVYEDEFCIAFLDKHPRQYGHTLVAPKSHREHVIGDFTDEEYVHLQQAVYRVGRAVQSTVPTERLYVICYGSQQGFSHVHWQVVPLPPGVPLAQQQSFATNPRNGILQLSADEMADLASRIRDAIS